MSKAWFRMYAEFVSDAKVQLLAFEDQRHFIALLCLKCNGTLDSEVPSDVFRDRMVAKALGLSPDAAMEARRRLVEIGVISDDWQPIKWADRQFESDSSSERTKAYRHRKSQERHRDVTVTPQNRTEQNRTEQKDDKPTRPARGSRMPADFNPDTEYARQQIHDIDADGEAQRFRDYWQAKAGATAVKSDWPATWRNWIRNCRDSGKYSRKTSAAFGVVMR